MSQLRVDGSSKERPAQIREELADLAGLHYDFAEKLQYENGTAPGCHEPILYVIARLVSEGKVKSIAETGSGMTTLFFKALAAKYHIPYFGIETHTEWYNLTSKLLKDLGLSTEGLVLGEIPNIQIPFSPDLLFIDHGAAPGLVTKSRSETLKNYYRIGTANKSTITMIDDCEYVPSFCATVAVCQDIGIKLPRLLQSESRGIAIIDPNNKIDFVDNWRM